MTFPVAPPALAIPCFEIYADYDANAPDTAGVILVSAQALAERLCEELNEDPQACVKCVVDGWEHAKSWAWRPTFAPVADQGKIHTTLQTALDEMTDDDISWGEDTGETADDAEVTPDPE